MPDGPLLTNAVVDGTRADASGAVTTLYVGRRVQIVDPAVEAEFYTPAGQATRRIMLDSKRSVWRYNDTVRLRRLDGSPLDETFQVIQENVRGSFGLGLHHCLLEGGRT